jgi:hypothetical protein
MLGVGLRAGYMYGSPHAGLRLSSGVLIEVPARLRLLARGAVELSLETTAGVAIGTNGSMAVLGDSAEEIFDPDGPDGSGSAPAVPEVFPIAPMFTFGILGSWRISDAFVLKFGIEVPTTLVLAMAEPPFEDVLELTISIDPFLGLSWAVTDWLSIYLVAGAGPALVWVPEDWTSDHYVHEIRVEPHLRGAAGVVFTPWP